MRTVLRPVLHVVAGAVGISSDACSTASGRNSKMCTRISELALLGRLDTLKLESHSLINGLPEPRTPNPIKHQHIAQSKTNHYIQRSPMC